MAPASLVVLSGGHQPIPWTDLTVQGRGKASKFGIASPVSLNCETYLPTYLPTYLTPPVFPCKNWLVYLFVNHLRSTFQNSPGNPE
ncbi:hypothetical protein THAOC_31974 [Thalassiosira oceanica]|uniref:Uncharacterized protein n=1 Tax=Thalassiosira oceanica TaxID=159749 RepID=K0R872_THAOC|nr:hypothetical protein THAOC_31974 [Thalassiosira oceanica]|eukprot:EJK49175.1 hypothetical protein THAOC_31974 [Thalassiosira oceanica]